MKAYWQNLNDRERWVLGIGIISTLIYLFYIAIYAPLITAVSNKSTQLSEKKETLIWMQQVSKHPIKKKEPEIISNGRLLSLIATQLNSTSFKTFPYQLQQTASGEIQVNYDNVPFNLFLNWLWQLNNDYAVTLKQLSAEKTETAGVVKLLVIVAAQ